MPDDVARVIARILDGLRPARGDVRVRQLQQFVAGDEPVVLRGDAATASTRATGGEVYGAAGRLYGRAIYGG